MKLNGTTLFAVIVACLAAFTLYDYSTGQKKDEAKEQSAHVVHLPREAFSDVLIEGQTSKFELVKKERWVITQPFQEGADQQQVFSFLDQLASEKSQQVVNETPADLAPYGLTSPRFTLTLKTPTATQVLKLGTVKAYDGSLYAQIDANPRVLLVSSAWDFILSKPAKDFRDTRLFQREVKVDFDRVSVVGKDTRFELIRKDGNFEMPGSPEPLVQESVKAWLEQVKALRGVTFFDEIVPNLKPDYTITLEREGDQPFIMRIARDTKPQQYITTSTDLPGGFKSQVVTGQSAMNAILVRPDVFFDKRAPFRFPLEQVTHLKFFDARSGKTLDTSVDPKAPDPLLTQLQALDAVRFMGPAQKSSKFKPSAFKSKVTLLKADGSTLFEMSWGDVITEPATLERPEARILPVMTSLAKQVVGVPEKSLLDLAKPPEGKK